MKKVLALVMALVLVLSLAACGGSGGNKQKSKSIEDLECYETTAIPTFTSITGINYSDKTRTSEPNMALYTYDCKSEDLEKYVSYLTDNGYKKSDYGSSGGILLQKDLKNRLFINPYHDFSHGQVAILLP